MAIIDEADCNEDYNNAIEGREWTVTYCDEHQAKFTFWTVSCIVAWIIHVAVAILLCAWGCEGNHLDNMKAKEQREDRKKADLEAAEKRLQQ